MEVNIKTLSDTAGTEVKFELVTSNESLKLSLENAGQPGVIVIGSPINQVAAKIEKYPKKGKDETIRTVVCEHVKIINESASARTNTMHLIMPPFLRKDPVWIEDKLALMLFYMKDYITKLSPWNTVLGSTSEILEVDLDEDVVHLNEGGRKKFYATLVADLLKLKECMGEEDEDREVFDWASQFSNASEPPTPSTLKKRIREEQSDDEEMEVDNRKKAKVDSLSKKMDDFLAEMRKDWGQVSAKVTNLEQKSAKTDEKLVEISGQVVSLVKSHKSEVTLTAEMREDIDTLENENLKAIVIIRKLPTKEKVPKERKLLRAFIQQTAKALVGEILNEDAATQIKFVATLYLTIDPTKEDNKAGLVPPFKIGFRTKDQGVHFREEAVKAARALGSKYSSTYFTHCQGSATRIRTQLMWAVVDAIKANHDEVWVSQGPRPMLQIKKGERIIGSYNFVKTMTLYRSKISQKKLEDVRKTAAKFFSGKLEKTFIVLKD